MFLKGNSDFKNVGKFLILKKKKNLSIENLDNISVTILFQNSTVIQPMHNLHQIF